MGVGKYLSSLTKSELDLIILEANFTDEEKKIFGLLAKGCSIAEISFKLSVCDRTINRRIKNIERKISKAGGKNGKSNNQRKRN